MGELVNLKRVRKQRARDEAAKNADLNRTKFGRTKSERDREIATAGRASEVLDQHKLPSKDGT